MHTMSTANAPIHTLSAAQISALLADLGQPSFRLNQLLDWLYVRQISSFDDMTNLPKALREQLAKVAPIVPLTVVDRRVSADGTRKYLFSLHDGLVVETVGIPSGSADAPRLTVCFSTQVGCAMGCAFCATGEEGFTRNLGMGEIVCQVLGVQRDFGYRVTNLVAMGQGEPFANYEMTLDALRVLNNPKGIAIGARKITVSTSGIIPGIRKFAEEPQQFTLAVSLHCARQAQRNRMMPGLAGQPLKDLRRALFEYVQATNRRVTLEYLMIAGVNDTDEDLEALRGFCDGLLCHVNLLPLNPIDRSALKPSKDAVMAKWIDALEEVGVEATVRRSRGSDIQGACGQLKNARG